MKEADLYLKEIKTQINFAKRAYESYLRALAKKDIISIFYHLHHFIVHAANIDKLLDLRPGSDRYRILRDCLNLADVKIKQFRKLRNHLEHFDERLDDWICKHYNNGYAFFDMNLVTGARGFPKKICLRALDGNKFVFYGEEFNILVLHEEIEKIEKSIKEAEQILNSKSSASHP